MPVDTKAATDRLMRFLSVEGITGQEAAIGRELTAALKQAGVPAKAIRLDDANSRIPVPTETGNLIVDLPGRGALHNQPRIMFMTHMDTVPLCAGAKPRNPAARSSTRRRPRSAATIAAAAACW
ncbi:tripeptide aminopeptidase [Bradyrhizobium daqingense]|uniref:Tripeptide aminopeptidase n=1 Tax=Bradyrhizobium daqingense TaxID=993502 RepID=A0A562LUZ4_9BRAD|nr:tripeptide aminopeptidase [Bradyrhizobium daqingense]